MVRLEIWGTISFGKYGTNLHSSMVRLEILFSHIAEVLPTIFTFQYGQIRNSLEHQEDQITQYIYIPVWLDQKSTKKVYITIENTNLHSSMVRLEINNKQHTTTEPKNLHSSMVRLEIYNSLLELKEATRFTFQYGQIRNGKPIDLRNQFCEFTFQYGQIRNILELYLYIVYPCIYIPVWLDQKCVYIFRSRPQFHYLHSSMVRLEIISRFNALISKFSFTFQYGQIRNFFFVCM